MNKDSNFYSNLIRDKGYCKISGIYTKEEINTSLELIKKIYEKQPQLADVYVPRLNKSSPNIYNLHAKNSFFLQLLFKSELIEGILINLLNDKYYKQISQDNPNFILRHMGARSTTVSLPLHIDSFIPYKGDEVIAVQMAIMLEDSSIENGCTEIVKESHLFGLYAPEEGKGSPSIHYLQAEAGDVLIWDSRCWHGTTENKTDKTRWSIIATFSRWFVKQMFNLVDNTPKEIWDQLTPKQKSILGACSVPFLDENQGIDMKRGYDIL